VTSLLDSGLGGKHACQVLNHVRAHREARELSQGQLATALGVSRQTINSIEVGRYTPSLPMALRLARFFSVSVEEMFVDDVVPAHR
jgi:putative transcriptional regulator